MDDIMNPLDVIDPLGRLRRLRLGQGTEDNFGTQIPKSNSPLNIEPIPNDPTFRDPGVIYPHETVPLQDQIPLMGMNRTGSDPLADIPQGGQSSDFQPEHWATDRMKSMIDSMPQRPDPSLKRNIGAGLITAFFGSKHGEDFRLSGYDNKMRDWRAQFDPLAKVGDQERYSNATERQHLNDVMDTKTAAEKMKIAQQRADSYTKYQQYKMDHPDYKELHTKGGDVLLLGPDGDIIDTGYNAGTQTDAESISQRGKIQKEIAAIPRTVNTSGTTTTTTTGGEGEHATQEKVAQYNRARQLFNTKPEFKKYIKLGDPGTNDFELTEPKSGSSILGIHLGGNDLTPEQYKQMQDFIYTGTPMSGAKTTTSARESQSVSKKGGPAPKPKSATPTAKTGKVHVKNTETGKTGTWDLSAGPIPKDFEEIP